MPLAVTVMTAWVHDLASILLPADPSACKHYISQDTRPKGREQRTRRLVHQPDAASRTQRTHALYLKEHALCLKVKEESSARVVCRSINLRDAAIRCARLLLNVAHYFLS
jgi:hypothetical protein